MRNKTGTEITIPQVPNITAFVFLLNPEAIHFANRKHSINDLAFTRMWNCSIPVAKPDILSNDR